MSADSNCHKVLMRALDYDEAGDKENAIKFYTEAVEIILSIDDKEKREKLNKFAKQALDRAEELRGIKSSPITESVPVKNATMPSISPAHSSKLAIVAKVPLPVVSASKLEVTSRDGYSLEEKKVLEKTSFINSRVYIPFLEEDTKERFNFPLPFTDKDGMLELSPKQKKEFAKWCRIGDLHPEPCIIAGTHADFYSIKQTLVSDCSFVSSLTVAALYEKTFNKRILTSIIYPRNSKGPIYNSSGKYTVKLYINGIARKVVIDDYLPIGKYNQLLCSYSSNKSESWISLMEKAYMKVMGGYDFPGSNSNIDCYALTGWIPERVSIRKDEPDFDANGVFNRLREGFLQGRCLITVATGDLSDAECERTGLVATHAFAVVNMAEVNGTKLLMLKNPWSHMKWKGNYSTNDTSRWTIELQNTLEYDLKSAQHVDNGVFWIDYYSLLNFFDVFYLNWDPELFKYTYCTHSLWNSGVGPSKDCYSVGDNPQYSLKVPAGRGSIYVLLTRHITTIEDFRENKEYITLLVYSHNNGKRIYYPHDPSPFIDGVRINSPHYLCKIRLDPTSSRNYTLVLSQFLKTMTIFYTLRAYCREPFELKSINNNYVTNMTVNGEWKTDNLTAGGCPNHRTYKNNPLYKVILPTDGNLIVELRGPKVYQVGLEVKITSLDDSNLTAPFLTKLTESFRSGFCVLDFDHIPAGVLHVRPSTFLPNQEAPFLLKFKSTSKIHIEREK